MAAHIAMSIQLAAVALVFIVVPFALWRMPASVRRWLGE